MSIIGWNCRGLGNLNVVPKLKWEMLTGGYRLRKPNVVMLHWNLCIHDLKNIKSNIFNLKLSILTSLTSAPASAPGAQVNMTQLKYIVRYYKSDALFLSETLVHSNKTNDFRYMLGFDNCFDMSSNGRNGGLTLFWQNSFNCTVLNYSNNHIRWRSNDSSRGQWQLTGFYGFPESGRRRDSWNFLRSLSNNISLPWCILGYFNDILDVKEKRRGSVRARWLINGFRQVVSDAGLVDVFMEGYPFTWFKSVGAPWVVEERFDRTLANGTWFQLFPNAKVENLVALASDHYPILLTREPVTRVWVPKRTFKFENAWCVEPGIHDVVSDSWLSSAGMPIIERLDHCAYDLTSWIKTTRNGLKEEKGKSYSFFRK